MRLLLFCCLGAAALPFAGWAQAPPAPAYPLRGYVGVGGDLGAFRPAANLVHSSTGWPRKFSPALLAGLQFQPRLAVQLSLAYYQDRYDLQRVEVASGPNPINQTYTVAYRYHVLVLPLLLRYTLTRQTAHPLQADLLGGVTLVRTITKGGTTVIDNNTQALLYQWEADPAVTSAALSLGAGLRYGLGPRWALAGNVLGNLTEAGLYYNFQGHMSLQLGVHYSLGAR